MTESPYTNPETQCISQQNAALLLSDNDNLCQSLDANAVAQQNREVLQTQYETLKQRFDKLKRDYDQASNYVQSTNKLSVAMDAMNASTTAANSEQMHKLSKFNGDTMTARRVGTIYQQNVIRTNVIIGYMQFCSIFFCVAILLMFPFAFTMVRSFFKHPVVVVQILLIALVVVGIIIVLLRLWSNRNHYRMLYQERVFGSPKMYRKTDDCGCDEPSEDVAPVAVDDTDDTCGA